MEHRLPVMRRGIQIVLVAALMLSMTASRAEVAVVLVTSSDSPITDISSLDTRKAYLGIVVTIAGGAVRPLRQQEDHRLNQVFLQSIIAMSEKSYERRLLSMMLKYGTRRPVEVDTHEELLETLTRNPHAIAYMWKSDAESDPRVKTIKVLWQER